MKKFLYLCLLITLCLNAMSQIDLYDRNWDTVFYDDFSSYRTWNPQTWISSDGKWKALAGDWVTHGGQYEHQIYQYQNCVFDLANNTMTLVSEYDWNGRIPTYNYSLPNGSNHWPNIYGTNHNYNNENELLYWYFFSGEIDVNNQPFGFGYFEIRCKLPLHHGSFPAFWLFGNGPHQYEEIDIFEYSESDSEQDSLRGYSSGIWFNPNTTNAPANYFKNHYHLSISEPDLGQYHTFGCEWMPDYVRLYRDGIFVNEYRERQYIPQYPKNIRINYALNNNSLNSNNLPNGWSGTDFMTIDYVKVCYLNWDCNTGAVITCQSDLDNFDYAVMKSIAISPTSKSVTVRNTDHVTFRATDYVEIEAPFTVEYGGEFTVIIQECPDN